MSVNKIILIGNCGKDPEIKNLSNGSKVATFTMATSETYKDKQGNKVVDTEWHDIEVWGVLAGVVENYVKKGTQLFIEGKIKTDTWEGKDGTKQYRKKVRVDNLTLLGQKQQINVKNENDGLPF